ncbi:serine/threonine-protein kinase StkP [Abditibacteriota bacterium]|nr:serine/threonine-protein kinase StkP [Abditibacteriota bacterium]
MPQLRHRPRDLVQGRYEIKKLLGSGAFGTVYGCLDGELETPVALKEMHVLDDRGGERAAALAQFRVEAIHLSRLNHPHIVRGHYQRDVGQWRVCPICGLDFPQLNECPDHGSALEALDSRHYLVMEYVGGQDLLTRAEEEGGRLDVDEAIGWMEQIASALAHVHARGFVHRDLKPENIRLRGDSLEAVLLDFGIASQDEGGVRGNHYGTRPRRATTGGGTLGYAPPTPQEAAHPDARSDVFAFGMTFYHLLCGLDPTEPTTERQMHACSPREFRSSIPGWLDELICDCIAFEPDRRPQNGTELLERLEMAEGEPEDDSQPTVLQPSHGVVGMGVPTTPTVAPTPLGTPLLFRSGHYARDLNDLVWLCDEYPDEAAKRLYEGEFERWLRSQNNEVLARAASSARQYPSKRAGLEHWVLTTGLVARSTVTLDPPVLDFGSFGKEDQKTRKLKLQKSGRGWVFGRATTGAGAVSTPGAFEGESPTIEFTFDAFRLRPGRYDGQIDLSGSMGDMVVPWTARVRGPSTLVPFLVVLANGAFGMVAGGALRAVPFLVADQQHPRWLGSNSLHEWWPIAPAFGMVMAFCWLLWTMAFALYRRSCGVLMTSVLMGTLVSAYAVFTGSNMLMGGDMWLKPHMQPIVHGFAPGGWMYAGATIGALAGAAWRWRDLASTRFWTIFVGFGATLLMVYLALEGALK